MNKFASAIELIVDRKRERERETNHFDYATINLHCSGSFRSVVTKFAGKRPSPL